MAFTKRLIESVLQTARSSTSGYQDDTEINRNLPMVESELMETLAPLYSTNQKVQDLLGPFVTDFAPTPVVDGTVSLPSDYVQIVDSDYEGKPVYKRNTNEISLIRTSATRKPTADGPYYCYFTGGQMKVLPDTLEEINLSYIRRPIPAEIAYNIVSTDQSDYVEVSVVRESEWPERAFNLLYYMLLEKFGIEQESQLSMEYSQLGINKEVSKL